MKAVQITAPSEMRVVEVEKPAVSTGEVLVKIKYVGFCGSDLNTFAGRNPMVKLPVIPGHEVGAIIEEVGPGRSRGIKERHECDPESLHQLRKMCFLPFGTRQCLRA